MSVFIETQHGEAAQMWNKLLEELRLQIQGKIFLLTLPLTF